MTTRQEALAASSPYLWVLAGQAAFLVTFVAAWNVWDRREQIVDCGVRLLERARA